VERDYGKMKYVCEICGRTEIKTPEEAYQEGWDYPPFMGSYGVVSARTSRRKQYCESKVSRLICRWMIDGCHRVCGITFK